ASATVGTSIADQATVSGGYNPTGTVTFNLYSNATASGTPLYTSPAVTLVNGVATSPGYTATATGTDYWVATYNGNTNNASVSSGAAAEPVVITPVAPSLTTTPGGTVTIGSFSISGTKYCDATGSGFSAGNDTPQAGVTINLYEQANGCTGLVVGSGGDTFVASTTTLSNGTYSFTLSNPGTYYVQESVPSGYIQTGGGPNGSAGNTYYTINATDGYSYAGNNFADYLIPNCCPSSGYSFKVTTPGGSSQTVSNLSGNTAQGDTVTVTLPSSGTGQYTLVSYIAPTPTFLDSNAYEQEIYSQASGTYASAPNHTLTVTIPNCDYQIDFVCGQAITQLEPNQNNDAYGPDSANVLYHAQDRFISGDNGGTTTPTPTPSAVTPATPPSPTTSGLLTDSATLSGGSSPTGTITFTLNNSGGTTVYTDVVTVNGDGTYSTSTGNNSGGYAPTAAGTYQWVVVYSGDSHNSGVTSPSGNEPETVSPASPTVCTVPGGTVTLGSKQSLTDTATLSGGYNPGGTIIFYLFAPGVTPKANDSNNVYSDTVTVSSNGTYSTGTGTITGTAVPTTTGTYEWVANYSGDGNNNAFTSTFGGEPETVAQPCQVKCGQFGTCGYWNQSCGQQVICGLGSGSSCTNLGNWLATNYPHLFGCDATQTNSCLKNLTNCTNSQVASFYQTLYSKNTSYAQIMATALACYATDTSQGNTCAASNGLSTQYGGNGVNTWNVGSNGSCLGLSNNTSYSVLNLLSAADGLGSSKINSNIGTLSTICNGINTTGGVTNASLGNSSLAFTPAQIRGAYGINDLSLDGTGQTIAIVDAYDNPDIYQSLDAFDTQFGITTTGQTLYQQYGPASSFLTVLNQSGQTTNLPAADPNGVGFDNWELETALDVEWAHAVAPGAQIVLVEANSQSLSDLMASVATAASQPKVSVVTMSWGFPEGQAVFAADEATYDSVFNVPGVTFVASTGDYGTADPEYPAFSPNVVAVGGTSLILNSDQSYNSETGWGYYSDSLGAAIGSGGGISQFESEPAYQQGVQSTGFRTTPDVSLVADPATGAWVADTYNLGTSNPFEVAGGTSLSAPAFAGLILLANEGRVASGEATLNSVTPTDTQQALYMLPQSDYNSIASGTNGYNANAGYNLVTGLGTPVANLMVPDLIAYHGPGTTYAGPTVSPLQDATLYSNWSNGGGTTNAFNVFSALTATGGGFSGVQSPEASFAMSRAAGVTQAPSLVNLTPTVAATTTQSAAIGSTFEVSIGSFSLHGPAQSLGSISNPTSAGMTSAPLAGVSSSSFSTGLVSYMPVWSTPGQAVSSPSAVEHQAVFSGMDRPNLYADAFVLARPRRELAAGSVLDDGAANLLLSRGQDGAAPASGPALPPTGVTVALDAIGPGLQLEQDVPSAKSAAGLVVFGLAAGLWAACGTGIQDARKRLSGSLRSRSKSFDLRPGKEAW
ncbi:MAG: SpaA isopeptide-forming pilin-related protein, partial [Isosphaeraceae bacterium]